MDPNEVPNVVNDTTSDRLASNFVDFFEQPEQFEIGQSFFMPTRHQAPPLQEAGNHMDQSVQTNHPPRWSLAYDQPAQVNQLAINRVDQQDATSTTDEVSNAVGRVMFDDENDIRNPSENNQQVQTASSTIDHIARELERLRETERALEYHLLQRRNSGRSTTTTTTTRKPEASPRAEFTAQNNSSIARPSAVMVKISDRASSLQNPKVRLSPLIKYPSKRTKLKFPKRPGHDVTIYNQFVSGPPKLVHPQSSTRSVDLLRLPIGPMSNRFLSASTAAAANKRRKLEPSQLNTRILPSSSTQWSTELKLDTPQQAVAKNEQPPDTAQKDTDSEAAEEGGEEGESGDEEPRSPLDSSSFPISGSNFGVGGGGGDINSIFSDLDAASPGVLDGGDLFELRDKILPPANSPSSDRPSHRHHLAFYQRPRQYGNAPSPAQLISSISDSYSPQQSLSRYHHDQMSRPSYPPVSRKHFRTRPLAYGSADHYHSDGTHSHKVIHIHTKEKKKHSKYLWPILGGGLTMLMGFLIISNMLLSIPLLAIGASSLFNHGGYHTQQLIPVYNMSQLVPQRLGAGRRKRHVLSETAGSGRDLQLRPKKLLARILASLAQGSNRCRVASITV